MHTQALSYSLIGFRAKDLERTVGVYNSLYWCVHILVVGLWLLSFVVPARKPRSKDAKDAKDAKKAD